MSSSIVQRKTYTTLDLMKFVMALAIMFAHICSENVTVHPILKLLTSVYNFGVPFFFACSGYLFFLKLKNTDVKDYTSVYKKFTKRILLMYLVWSCIYFCFVLTNWIQDGASVEDVLRYFHKAIVFTTYGTIWFLPSLWIGVSITFFLLYRNIKVAKIVLIAVVFYIIGSFGFSYLPLSEGTFAGKIYQVYNDIFVTSRNGIFAGFPFVAIGALLAFKGVKKKSTFNLVMTLLFGSLFILEAVFIKNKMNTNVDMGFFLVPSIYFLMSWLIQFNLPTNPIYIRLRNLSMLIFLGQRLFITAIPSVLPISYMDVITKNNYVGLFIFVGVTITFALLIEQFSKKYKWLNVLW
ncbi:acyltransferase [Marinifilum sp. D714]|uniref:acyltransferase family protein n=1 Tax=Marinifilum sp. D714 TaxID=2937523 RepID=UPI0027CD2C7C|nr:acyltransferase [Marinifilum sp. D714]MDQ2178545.1 acyltransferase [Marinifilum sp. D714]